MNGPSHGILIVGLMPGQPIAVARTAAGLAAELGASLRFAYVERNTALIEQEKPALRERMSLDPPVDEEMAALAEGLRHYLGGQEWLSSIEWELRILGGDPAKALARLGRASAARMLVIGGTRRGLAHRLEDALSGSEAGWLFRHQALPVLVVPDDGTGAVSFAPASEGAVTGRALGL